MKIAIDPRTKIILLLSINVIVFLTPGQLSEWMLISAIAIYTLAMGGYRSCIRSLAFYGAMTAVLACTRFMPQALGAVISMTFVCFRKILPITMFAGGIIATTKVSELVGALSAMRLPRQIIITFAVTLRFFPTAKEEYAQIKDALKMRGLAFSAKNILTKTDVLLECAIVPIIMRSSIIAEELAAASITRGIDRVGMRSSYHRLALGAADVMGLTLFAGLMVLILSGGMERFYGAV